MRVVMNTSNPSDRPCAVCGQTFGYFTHMPPERCGKLYGCTVVDGHTVAAHHEPVAYELGSITKLLDDLPMLRRLRDELREAYRRLPAEHECDFGCTCDELWRAHDTALERFNHAMQIRNDELLNVAVLYEDVRSSSPERIEQAGREEE